MPTTVTYASLLDDCRRYLERGGSALADPTVYDQLPRLINATERKIANFLKLQGMIEALVDPTGLQVGTPVVTKPDRWRSTVSFNYGAGAANTSRTFLFPRGYEYCRAYWPDDSVRAAPEFYADYDLRHWLIVPTPDATYPIEVLCYMQPPLLDDGTQTNFFTDYTPNLLLYGTLLEAEPFLKNDERIPTWRDKWNDDGQALLGQDLQKILDRAAQRKAP